MKMFTYKVVEKKQKSFLKRQITGKALEEIINTHAKEGWELDRLITGETAKFMGYGEKDVFLIIFRKEVQP